MKPAPFDYFAPETLDDALRLLARYGAEGKVLAGGQSLVPLLNFRLARPVTVIDINRLSMLAYVRLRSGTLHVGALTRHRVLETSPVAREGWPLLGEAFAHLAHPQIRNRGTVGGSAAHADPSAELPVVLTALNARFVVMSLQGNRTLSAEEMFEGQLTSALQDDELLVEIQIPPVATPSGWAFTEFARRHGDYALGGVAVQAARAGDRLGDHSRIVLLGAGPVPVRASAAEVLVASRPFTPDLAAEASAVAADAAQPPSDMHGDAEYRRGLIGSLARRALLTAWERSQ